MSGIASPAARIAALVVAAGVALAGCAGPQGNLPQEGGQGAVTAGPAPEATGTEATDEETGVTGPQPDDDQTAEASQECLDAVRTADEEDATADGGGAADDPTGVATEEGFPTGQDDGSRPGAALFPAFDACQDVEEFRAATSAYEGVLDGNDPADFVVVTCESEEAVEGTPLCESAAGSEDPAGTGGEGTEDDAGSTDG